MINTPLIKKTMILEEQLSKEIYKALELDFT